MNIVVQETVVGIMAAFAKRRSRQILVSLTLGTLAGMYTLAADASSIASGMAAMDYFTGAWNCAGSFPSTGKTIASAIRFDPDLGGHAMVKHHDDVPPAVYHAIEVWLPHEDGHDFREVIVDNFGGLRHFHSDGWQSNTLIWQSAADVAPIQRFVYVRTDDNTFRLDWEVSKDGKDYKVGDTLTCKRRAT